MIELQTERLVLRNYRISDTAAVHAYFSHPDVAKYEDFDSMSMDEVAEMVEEWSAMDNRLVAVRKSDGQLIGSVGYWIDEDSDYSIDYDFNPQYGKQGYATEAVTELLRYLFDGVGIQEIFGDCDIRNENSWHLMERVGFKRMRQLDGESYKNDENGQPILISIYLYLLTEKEYRA